MDNVLLPDVDLEKSVAYEVFFILLNLFLEWSERIGNFVFTLLELL